MIAKALAEQCQNAEELQNLAKSRQVPAILFISHQCAQHGHTSFDFPHYLYPETLAELESLGFVLEDLSDDFGKPKYNISWR